MATIIPFKGIRPSKDKVHLVASRSVDNYTKDELHDKMQDNPFTFLHVIIPDFSDGQKTAPGSDERLQKTKRKYEQFYNDGIFIQDKEQSYYIYQQQKGPNTFTGIFGCISIDDYSNGTIKIHEQTITEREEKLMHYLEVCDYNAEPILFSYPNDPVIDEITAKIISTTPENDYTTHNAIRHKLWPVTDPAIISTIRERFKKIPAVYIADGHHRSASSALLGKMRREQNPGYTGNEPYNFYLGAFFPKTQLRIYDFNRIVHDLNGLSEKEFLDKIKVNFNVEEKNEVIYKPAAIHNFSMYLNKKWYQLTPKSGIVHNEDPVGSLDASILTEHILSPILGIHDLKTDKRIGFIPGDKGMEELKKQVDKGKTEVAFGLYPVSMEQLKLIADTHHIMPPKTTWVEPKMRSALVIYSLK